MPGSTPTAATTASRSRPQDAWQPGRIVTDTHTFTVSPEAAPGSYQIEASLYTRPDFDRLGLVHTSGAEGADRLLLGPVRVVQR